MSEDEPGAVAQEAEPDVRARARSLRVRGRLPWTWLALGLVVVLLAIAGTYVYFSYPLRAQAAAEEAVADLNDIRFDSTAWKDSTQTLDLFHRVVAGLGEPLRSNGTVELGEVEVDGGSAVAKLSWTWADANQDEWTYESELPLHKNGLFWWAGLSEAAIHPELGTGGVLEARANPGKRGAILGADGESLMAEGTVVEIGVHPARLEADTLDTLAEHLNDLDESLNIDPRALETKVDEVDKDQLVPVISLRESDYKKVKDDIHSLPGVIFNERTRVLSRKRDFAQATLGTAGPVTAEEVEKSDGALKEGAIVGKSGLQRSLDEVLGGPANERVFAQGAKGGELVSLHEFPQRNGQDVTTTLDVGVQEAADEAASTAKKPAAVVAIRPSDGHVLAVANHDPQGAGWDRALTGQYAPGSVFKIASGLALVEAGITPETRLDCPKTTTVNGKSFKNAEDHVLGEVPFEENFAESCNTAFVEAGAKVSSADVANAAMNLGMGDFDLGVDSKMAVIPINDDPVVHAASMIGQGEILASPLSVAVMSASVAAGDTVSPLLVLPDERSTVDEVLLDKGSVEQVQEMMRRTVTEGTASELKNVPGEPVHGKTGTAEYGSDSPPRTHSWFAGYQGDVAVAVLVEDGGFGADAAVPVAKTFFEAMNK